MLVFKTDEELINALVFFSKMSFDEYKNWCKDNNFTSLQILYHNALDIQADFNEKNENINDKSEKYCKEIQYLLNESIITKNANSSFEDYSLNTCRVELSYVLNQNKMISLKGDIYQYNKDNIIIIKNNDFSLINNISNIKETVDGKIIIWKPDNLERIDAKPDTIYINQRFAYGTTGNVKRNVSVMLRASSNQASYNGPYIMSFYTVMKHYKNDNLNKCRSLGLLKNTSYSVYQTMIKNGIEVEECIHQDNFPSNELVYETSIFTKNLINGAHPTYNTPSVIHFPHIKSGFIYYYAKDSYWIPFQTIEVTWNSFIYGVPEVYLRR